MANLIPHHYTLEGVPEGAKSAVEVRRTAAGLEQVSVSLTFAQPVIPPVIQLTWTHPMLSIQHYWHPRADRNRGLQADWAAGHQTQATYSAPVGCFFSNTGRNRLTFAWSDALNPLQVHAGLNEESAMFKCRLELFGQQASPLVVYRAELLVDTRDIPYYEALDNVQQWWAAQPGYEPATVPQAALEPMYSTWYSFHQQLSPSEVEAQCRLAAALGCGAVIVDDGWQTADNGRGYAYCGDWELSADKFQDMKAHVAAVQQLGMKYLLWYSVPFVGKHSKAWHRLQHQMLYVNEELGAGIVDPRYAEVREYLLEIYETAVRTWGMDGLKLDFVDQFKLPPKQWRVASEHGEPQHAADAAPAGAVMDTPSLAEAVDWLLSDVITRLRAINPDIMIEFRQSYIGPLMRKYGNMFRATDCPGDALSNRIRTIDLRLLSGNTAVHSDMVMWHPEDTAASAALQLINILFAVPQISVQLDKLPREHADMLAFWLNFWRQYRDVLLHGKLEPLHPEMLYPVVKALSSELIFIVQYQQHVLALEDAAASYVLVNGTLSERMVVETKSDLGLRRVRVLDCCGQEVAELSVELAEGVRVIEVPPSGVVLIAEGER
ncbi:alpha-galactosidase [Paenibacillaceae bacterium]|nr:alpha-galactosidase [Paenibacillaceae bacterium]